MFLFSLYMCHCEWGVSLSGPQGRNPLLVFTVATAVFFWVKNNNQIRGYVSHTCCALIASESRRRLTHSRTEAETRAALGCVMSEEALWASNKATAVCVHEC